MVDLRLKREDVALGQDIHPELYNKEENEVRKESADLQVLNEKVQINFDEQ